MEQLTLQYIELYGLIAIFLFMMTNGFASTPPSEAVFGLAGVLVSSGTLKAKSVIIAGVLGNVTGTTLLYLVGFLVGYEWLIRIKNRLTECGGLTGRAARWLPDRHFYEYFIELLDHRAGFFYVGGLRCFPMIRSIISLPAGMLRMRLWLFVLCTTIGCLVWALFWTMLGYLAGESWRYWSPKITIVLLSVLVVLFFYIKSALKKFIVSRQAEVSSQQI